MNVEQKILQVIAENSSKKSFRVNELEGFVVHRFLSPILEVIELPGQNKLSQFICAKITNQKVNSNLTTK
jgi:hypothetical protein